MATSPQYAATPKTVVTQFAAGDGTTGKDLFTAGSNGSWVVMAYVSHNDTVVVSFIVSLIVGGVEVDIDRISLPAASATTRVKYNLLDPGVWTWIDPNNIGFPLAAGAKLRGRMGAALSAGVALNAVVHAGDY